MRCDLAKFKIKAPVAQADTSIAPAAQADTSIARAALSVVDPIVGSKLTFIHWEAGISQVDGLLLVERVSVVGSLSGANMKGQFLSSGTSFKGSSGGGLFHEGKLMGIHLAIEYENGRWWTPGKRKNMKRKAADDPGPNPTAAAPTSSLSLPPTSRDWNSVFQYFHCAVPSSVLTGILTAIRVDINAKFDVLNAKFDVLNANVKELRTLKGHYAVFLGVVAVYNFLNIDRYEDMEGNLLEP